MCAQAACFMATSLMHGVANGIFGVPEITALAKGEAAEELLLGGMGHFDILSYFRHPSVGLWASHQTTAWLQPLFKGQFLLTACVDPVSRENRDELQMVDLCGFVLNSYVMSGMPVIVPLDMGRMEGKWNPGG